MDYNLKWIRPNISIDAIKENSKNSLTILNSGILSEDFYTYANNFYDAAEYVIHYLIDDASINRDIEKLDLWYFAMIYLYRQSLELLVKANILQEVSSDTDRKIIIGEIRHDIKQGFDKVLELKNLKLYENENTSWLGKFLSDISSIDKESDMFRYPFGSNLKVLFDEQTNISLIITQNNISRAFCTLKDIYATGTHSERKFEVTPPKLIVEGGDYYHQSVVGYKFSNRSFYPYYTSYKEVGDFLKNKILEENKENLFMPMCYMYRNAVELGLKRIILEDSHIDYTKALKILRRKKHSILGLWNSIVDEIDKYSNAPTDDTTLSDATQYIEAFHTLDQNSDLFRYPCNKNMEVYFDNKKIYDVENVSSCFEELCIFLECVDDMLGEIKEFEMEEMADYY